MIDISVIVPIYKGQKYIPSILKMVSQNVEYASMNGNMLKVELLFVNDFPDEVIHADGLFNDYEVKIIDNEKNKGIHQTRVNGLEQTKGEFVLFLDQDDEITSNCLMSQYLAIGDNDIVVGNGYRGVNGNYRKIYRSVKKQKLSCKEKFFLRAANQIVSPGQCLIRRSAIPVEWCENVMKDNGGDDLFLWLLMFERDKKFCINSECIYKHVDTGSNLSSDLAAMYLSSDNLIRTVEQTGILEEKTFSLYKRRIKYLKTMQKKSMLGKIMTIFCNLDICITKLYAYYR